MSTEDFVVISLSASCIRPAYSSSQTHNFRREGLTTPNTSWSSQSARDIQAIEFPSLVPGPSLVRLSSPRSPPPLSGDFLRSTGPIVVGGTPAIEVDPVIPYDDLCDASGRLHVTIALGAGSKFEPVLRTLRQMGYKNLLPSRINARQRQRLGMDDPVRPHTVYMFKPAAKPEMIIKIICGMYQDDARSVYSTYREIGIDPDREGLPVRSIEDSAALKATFVEAFAKDGVVAYFGHANWGTGPSFAMDDSSSHLVLNVEPRNTPDHPDAPQTLIDRLRQRDGRNDCDTLRRRPTTQLLFLYSCTSEVFCDALRDGQEAMDQRILATSVPVPVRNTSLYVRDFLVALERRADADVMSEQVNRRVADFFYGDFKTDLAEQAQRNGMTLHGFPTRSESRPNGLNRGSSKRGFPANIARP